MRILFRRVHEMDVDVDSWDHDAEPADTSLFFSLTQGDMCQVSVAVCVATRLKPTLQLGMEEQ